MCSTGPVLRAIGTYPQVGPGDVSVVKEAEVIASTTSKATSRNTMASDGATTSRNATASDGATTVLRLAGEAVRKRKRGRPRKVQNAVDTEDLNLKENLQKLDA